MNDLPKLLPCSACLAGKARKTKKQPVKNFTDTANLTTILTNAPLSWTPTTEHKVVEPNQTISLDWGIINKTSKSGTHNVFALFLDINTGLVFVYPAESRGQAGDALQAYIKRYGKPHKIIHDNAKEFCEGDFAEICNKEGITQNRSPPYEPNHNPVEHYMDIIVSMARSMLFVSGLDPTTYWTHALEHAVYLQIRTALPGRATPFELSFGRRPNITNLRIFGCEALSYVEKSKRTKFNPKVERAIYLGVSSDHTEDTYKLVQIATQSIIYRRNVFFNERSFPAQKTKSTPLTTANLADDTGQDLIGCDFEDDNIMWTVTRTGTYEGTPVLFYKNRDTGEEESSSVPEVRLWHSQTTLRQAINQLKPTRKGYINTLAEESFKAI
jgi:hypothetical protein